ncbi:MAG TPA: alkane 1-monooxygenase [Rhodanobacteraceae bacterium]|nr:alkane 1-monooxygenase [Rhodanobacteraceae bacterium]
MRLRLHDLGYLLALGTALLPWGALGLHRLGLPLDLAAWFPVLFVFGVVPLIDLAFGVDRRNPADADEAAAREHALYFRLLTWLCVPLWLGALAWCLHIAITLSFGPLGLLGWLLGAGVIGGALAINVAHELIHKPGRFEPALGGILLTSVGYPGFKIEHLRGHHVHVSTPRDRSSAPLGMGVWRFLPRALIGNSRAAWMLEAERLQARGLATCSWHNELLRWGLLWLAFVLAAFAGLGLRGMAAFIAIGLIAAATLEVINYVEHYGLERRELAPGRFERVTHLHSWNASQRYSNWLLFELQRHSDHHAHARRRYPALLHHADSPQLPVGYATMFVLALIPPLWRRVMDPRARACGARALGDASTAG